MRLVNAVLDFVHGCLRGEVVFGDVDSVSNRCRMSLLPLTLQSFYFLLRGLHNAILGMDARLLDDLLDLNLQVDVQVLAIHGLFLAEAQSEVLLGVLLLAEVHRATPEQELFHALHHLFRIRFGLQHHLDLLHI